MRKFFLIAGLGALGYTTYYIIKQINKLNNICIGNKKIKIISFENDGVKLQLIMDIYNKSDFKVEIPEYNFLILLNQKRVALAKSERGFTIYSNERHPINIYIFVKFSDIKDSISSAILDIINMFKKQAPEKIYDNIKITIDGYLSIRTSLISLNKYKYRTETTLGELLTSYSSPSTTSC